MQGKRIQELENSLGQVEALQVSFRATQRKVAETIHDMKTGWRQLLAEAGGVELKAAPFEPAEPSPEILKIEAGLQAHADGLRRQVKAETVVGIFAGGTQSDIDAPRPVKFRKRGVAL